MAVIYLATNKKNGKAYVGFTKGTAENRFAQHCVEGHGLHEAIQKHGAENFTLEVLEESSDWLTLVTEREPYYIEKHNTLRPNGYNRTKGGEYSTIDGIDVDVYDTNLKYIETIESIRGCARKYDLNPAILGTVCKNAKEGKASRLGDYYFCYSGDSVRHKVWNTTPGMEAARKVNKGRKRPEQAEVMRRVMEAKRDTTVYTFIHKDGRTFTGSRYDLKEYDQSVSIGELGVLIKGGYKSHRGWTIGK